MSAKGGVGRKRHNVADTQGRLLAAVVLQRISTTGMEHNWFYSGWRVCFPTCACSGPTAGTQEP